MINEASANQRQQQRFLFLRSQKLIARQHFDLFYFFVLINHLSTSTQLTLFEKLVGAFLTCSTVTSTAMCSFPNYLSF